MIHELPRITFTEWRQPRAALGHEDHIERQVEVTCRYCAQTWTHIVYYKRLDMHMLDDQDYYRLRFIKLCEGIGRLVGLFMAHMEKAHGMEV
jgi:hypothetical protein